MNTSDLLADVFGRIPELVHGAVEGLSPRRLAFRLDPGANSIAWLVWHLARIEDDHVAEVAGLDQVWVSGGWARRFDLGLDDADTGYGHTSRQVAAVRSDAELLLGYFDAAHEMATRFVQSVTDSDLDRIVDPRWDPPVTLGVRLVSVAGHNFEQAAQAAYIRGVLERKAHRRTGSRTIADE